MGIRTLSSFVNQHHTTKSYPIASLSNKTIAVDSSIFLYEWMKSAMRCKLESELSDDLEDKPEYHWEWHCVRSLDTLRKYKIKLIFLFEYSHPDEKDETVKSRKIKKEQSAKQSDELMELSRQLRLLLETIDSSQYVIRKAKNNAWKGVKDLLSLCRLNSVRATSDIYQTFQKIIEFYGLRWLECQENTEAEYVAVDMVHYGMADYVMSNDSDCIACLCDKYITNIDWEHKTFDKIAIKELIRSMKITPEQFQIACCCMGNDYIKCLFKNGLYWTGISRELKSLNIRKKSDMLKQFNDYSERLSFCWNLYKRNDRKSKTVLQKWLKGTGSVSPKELHNIRTIGVCV